MSQLGSVSGTTKPHALVELKNIYYGTLRSMRADENGSYRFQFLQPGEYELSEDVRTVQVKENA